MNRRTVALAVIAAVKTVVSLALLWSGFRAISDDDFSRVAIAQLFAVHPQLDPSGSSWLPLPFWVYGGAMKAFGVSLAIAQLTALVLGVYSAVAVWFAAGRLGLSPRAALLGSLVAACIPHSALYGAAMVPDYPSAALALVASATLSARPGPGRALGALAACLGTLCRYETWPIACVVVAFALLDARREHRARREQRWLLGSAALAPAGALAWMLHGLWHHHDAVFFFKRVSAYRHALSDEALPWFVRLLKHPAALFSGEPELLLVVGGLLLAVGLAMGARNWPHQMWVRPAWALGSVVGFLVVGDLSDGSPTHHEERTLLVVWLGLSLLAGDLADRLWDWMATRFKQRAVLSRAALIAVIGMCIAAGMVLRPRLGRTESFVDRSKEIAIGQIAALVVPQGERLAVHTEDYGYFAVEAAFGRPTDSAPLMKRDPRRPETDPLANPTELEHKLDAMQTRHLILPATHRAALGARPNITVDSDGFLLVERN